MNFNTLYNFVGSVISTVNLVNGQDSSQEDDVTNGQESSHFQTTTTTTTTTTRDTTNNQGLFQVTADNTSLIRQQQMKTWLDKVLVNDMLLLLHTLKNDDELYQVIRTNPEYLFNFCERLGEFLKYSHSSNLELLFKEFNGDQQLCDLLVKPECRQAVADALEGLLFLDVYLWKLPLGKHVSNKNFPMLLRILRGNQQLLTILKQASCLTIFCKALEGFLQWSYVEKGTCKKKFVKFCVELRDNHELAALLKHRDCLNIFGGVVVYLFTTRYEDRFSKFPKALAGNSELAFVLESTGCFDVSYRARCQGIQRKYFLAEDIFNVVNEKIKKMSKENIFEALSLFVETEGAQDIALADPKFIDRFFVVLGEAKFDGTDNEILYKILYELSRNVSYYKKPVALKLKSVALSNIECKTLIIVAFKCLIITAVDSAAIVKVFHLLNRYPELRVNILANEECQQAIMKYIDSIEAFGSLVRFISVIPELQAMILGRPACQGLITYELNQAETGNKSIGAFFANFFDENKSTGFTPLLSAVSILDRESWKRIILKGLNGLNLGYKENINFFCWLRDLKLLEFLSDLPAFKPRVDELLNLIKDKSPNEIIELFNLLTGHESLCAIIVQAPNCQLVIDNFFNRSDLHFSHIIEFSALLNREPCLLNKFKFQGSQSYQNAITLLKNYFSEDRELNVDNVVRLYIKLKDVFPLRNIVFSEGDHHVKVVKVFASLFSELNNAYKYTRPAFIICSYSEHIYVEVFLNMLEDSKQLQQFILNHNIDIYKHIMRVIMQQITGKIGTGIKCSHYIIQLFGLLLGCKEVHNIISFKNSRNLLDQHCKAMAAYVLQSGSMGEKLELCAILSDFEDFQDCISTYSSWSYIGKLVVKLRNEQYRVLQQQQYIGRSPSRIQHKRTNK